MLRKFIESNAIIPQEVERGNIEYKLRLNDKDCLSLEKMTSQMLWRMNEGKKLYGRCEAYYYLGIEDDGVVGDITEETLDNSTRIIKNVANNCFASVTNVDKIKISEDRYVAEITIQKLSDNLVVEEFRTCVLGASGHGKTTILGNLIYHQNDDENGLSRMLILNYDHEKNTGITSSVKHNIIGFKEGKLINFKSQRISTWESIVTSSDKIISLFDLPGSVKYIRTLLFGILTTKPHFITIVISPTDCEGNVLSFESMLGIKIACLINIPFLIIFNKSDKLEASDVLVKNTKDMIDMHKHDKCIVTEYKNNEFKFDKNVIPYIHLSNIEGKSNLTTLCSCMHGFTVYIKKNIHIEENKKITEFFINNIYNIPDNGMIVSGILYGGTININDGYLIGPVDDKFYPVNVRTIHKKQLSCKSLYTDESGSLELKLSSDIEVTKHMVIVNDYVDKNIYNNVCSVKIDNKVQDIKELRTGGKYLLYSGNLIESVIIESVTENVINLKFNKMSNKYMKKGTICFLRHENIPTDLFVGYIC